MLLAELLGAPSNRKGTGKKRRGTRKSQKRRAKREGKHGK